MVNLDQCNFQSSDFLYDLFGDLELAFSKCYSKQIDLTIVLYYVQQGFVLVGLMQYGSLRDN